MCGTSRSRVAGIEYLTVGWNSLEGIIAIIFGVLAGSIALVGFGFDSVIEVSSGLVLLWRLHRDDDPIRRDQIEARALKLVGITFLILAAYVGYDAVVSLVRRESPEGSHPGIALAALSLVVMPVLAGAKRRLRRTSAAVRFERMPVRPISALIFRPFSLPGCCSTLYWDGGGPIRLQL